MASVFALSDEEKRRLRYLEDYWYGGGHGDLTVREYSEMLELQHYQELSLEKS